VKVLPSNESDLAWGASGLGRCTGPGRAVAWERVGPGAPLLQGTEPRARIPSCKKIAQWHGTSMARGQPETCRCNCMTRACGFRGS